MEMQSQLSIGRGRVAGKDTNVSGSEAAGRSRPGKTSGQDNQPDRTRSLHNADERQACVFGLGSDSDVVVRARVPRKTQRPENATTA
jgi:hypothetical protein